MGSGGRRGWQEPNLAGPVTDFDLWPLSYGKPTAECYAEKCHVQISVFSPGIRCLRALCYFHVHWKPFASTGMGFVPFLLPPVCDGDWQMGRGTGTGTGGGEAGDWVQG